MTTDAQAALAQVREALAAGPTPGRWFAVNDGNRTEPFMNVKAERISGRGPTHEVAICATGDSPQSMETANARYIAACSPVNIAAILAHFEAQAAEIKRLRKLAMTTHLFEEAPCFLCGYNGPGYYQPEQHPCAALYHEAMEEQR